MTIVYVKPDPDAPELKIQLNENECFLDGALRSGINIPFGCKSGVCQSCLMHSSGQSIPADAQKGLKEAQIEQGYFLACCCFPEQGFTAYLPLRSSKTLPSKVIEKKALSNDVFSIKVESVLDYRSGQYCTLWNQADIARSYSLMLRSSQSFL